MDIVIVFHSKDIKVLPYCLKGLSNIKEKQNVYLVSNEPINYENTTYIDEKLFPFTKKDIESYLYEKDYFRAGWYYQQLLKLYAYLVIPNLSDSFLILDTDTVFLNEISFFDNGKPLYATGREYTESYFIHMNKLVPGLVKQFPEKSGIVHHTLFQKKFLKEIFEKVESYHNVLFWKAMMQFVDKETAYQSGMAENETYFTYIFQFHKEEVEIRELRWQNLNEVDGWYLAQNIPQIIEHCKNYLDFVSLHAYILDESNIS
jgi:hypothetical protein